MAVKERPNLIIATQGDAVQNILKLSVAQRITMNAGSNRNATDFTSMIVEATPTVDCVVKIGDSTVVAKSGEDFFIPAYATKALNVGENTRIAAQPYISGETGTLFISEMA